MTSNAPGGSLTYTPDEDVKVHEEGAIRLLCRPFQSHETGLPEWLKNAADEYVGREAPPEHRVIVIIVDNGGPERPPSISCLDFSGMTSAVIENDFRYWADPEAASRRRGTRPVQGGHGNGGKCYMTQMFGDHSVLHTMREGLGNRYGVQAGSVRFGYIPNRNEGRDFPVADTTAELGRALSTIGKVLDDLPRAAQEAFEASQGFTLVSGFRPKGYRGRIPSNQLVPAMVDHPQMLQTLELCEVYVLIDKWKWGGGAPLTLPPIPPMAGEQGPRVVEVPETLEDPISKEVISTTAGGALQPGKLILQTSASKMTYRKQLRHTIVFRAPNLSGFLGYVPVPELNVESPYRNNIYGECHLDALDSFKQNERMRLAASPETRAVEAWISTKVDEYAREFERRDRRQYNQREKDALSRMNEALDNWKNEFLRNYMRGLWGSGNQLADHPPGPGLPSGTPVRVEVALSHSRAGVGVSFKPSIRFFDEEGRRIRSVPYRWVSEDTNVAMVDEDLLVVNTFSIGTTRLYAETLDGAIRSNLVPLEVVRLNAIVLSPSKVDLPLGTRQRLEALCTLGDGSTTSDVYLVWTESDPNIARVSASGLVFGFAVGETDVTAGDDRCMAKTPSFVNVMPNEGRGTGNQGKGAGFPRVLVSSVDDDPDTGADVAFSSEDPPVAQRPQDVDRNIWWINSNAPLAKMYLDSSKQYGYESREWRMYHLERYIDVMVQIAFTHGPTDADTLSADEWILKWGEQVARIQEAAVTGLAQFIQSGELPGR